MTIQEIGVGGKHWIEKGEACYLPNLHSEELTARTLPLLQQRLPTTAQDPNHKLNDHYDITGCSGCDIPPKQLLAPLPRGFALLRGLP